MICKESLLDGSAENSLRSASSDSSRISFGVLWLEMTEDAKVRVESMWATLGPE